MKTPKDWYHCGTTTRPLEGHPKIEDVAELKVSICSYETEEVTEELEFYL